jgi:hypothetical protein
MALQPYIFKYQRRGGGEKMRKCTDAVRVFPSNLIAGVFNFKIYQWERATDAQRQAVNAQNLL